MTSAEPLGRRARNRIAVEADILRVARAHLATSGAAALSLRAVARDLGMVSSGIYRYVESRDELLTRLIVDGYTSLAAAVTTAHDAVDPADLGGRWDAVAHALRAWALEHPHDFATLLGAKGVGPATVRALSLMAELIYDAPASHRDPATRKNWADYS